MVYIQNIEGKPLMPTERYRHVRKLLKSGRASIVCYTPFTIKLNYVVENKVQDISLGVDTGSKHVGLSATTDKKEVYAEVLQLRTDIKSLLEGKRGARRLRRNRLRYRAPRWQNRTHSKKPGWIAPTVQNKLHAHLKEVDKVIKILPITSINVETATFDVQKIKDPSISGVGYQTGDKLGFANTRQYVLWRDDCKCQNCKSKTKDKHLEVHHIIPRSEGGPDRLDNLITLCHTCHANVHKGEIKLKQKGNRIWYKDCAIMNILKHRVLDGIKNKYPDITVKETFGYVTKYYRQLYGLSKTHISDARCISGHGNVKPLDKVYWCIQKRKHNRKIYKGTIYKGGKLKRNQCNYFMFGFARWDKVKWKGQIGFVQSRRNNGWFEIKTDFFTKGTTTVKYTELRLIERNKTIITNIIGSGSIPIQH